MTITLYHGAISTCSQKVRLALAEKGLDFVSRPMNLSRREHLTEWYLKLNPNGVVPTMVHDDKVIVDSSVICEYLEEVFPDPPLAPRYAVDRAHMRAWMRYFEEVPTAAIRVPSYNLVFHRLWEDTPKDEFVELANQMPVRRHFYLALGKGGFDEKSYKESLERLSSCLKRVNTSLLDGRGYILGNDFSIADIIFVPSMVRMQDLELEEMWDDVPLVVDWFNRVKDRPSFNKAYLPGSRLRLTDSREPFDLASSTK